jgi:predicted DNA-binding ribbon-helix-helix protein
MATITNRISELPDVIGENGSCAMKSQIMKRSFVIAGQKKSISLEESVWRSLKEIATCRGVTLLALLTNIASTEYQGNLSSAVRLFILDFYREQLAIEAVLHSPIQALH